MDAPLAPALGARQPDVLRTCGQTTTPPSGSTPLMRGNDPFRASAPPVRRCRPLAHSSHLSSPSAGRQECSLSLDIPRPSAPNSLAPIVMLKAFGVAKGASQPLKVRFHHASPSHPSILYLDQDADSLDGSVVVSNKVIKKCPDFKIRLTLSVGIMSKYKPRQLSRKTSFRGGAPPQQTERFHAGCIYFRDIVVLATQAEHPDGAVAPFRFPLPEDLPPSCQLGDASFDVSYILEAAAVRDPAGEDVVASCVVQPTVFRLTTVDHRSCELKTEANYLDSGSDNETTCTNVTLPRTVPLSIPVFQLLVDFQGTFKSPADAGSVKIQLIEYCRTYVGSQKSKERELTSWIKGHWKRSDIVPDGKYSSGFGTVSSRRGLLSPIEFNVPSVGANAAFSSQYMHISHKLRLAVPGTLSIDIPVVLAHIGGSPASASVSAAAAAAAASMTEPHLHHSPVDANPRIRTQRSADEILLSSHASLVSQRPWPGTPMSPVSPMSPMSSVHPLLRASSTATRTSSNIFSNITRDESYPDHERDDRSSTARAVHSLSMMRIDRSRSFSSLCPQSGHEMQRYQSVQYQRSRSTFGRAAAGMRSYGDLSELSRTTRQSSSPLRQQVLPSFQMAAEAPVRPSPGHIEASDGDSVEACLVPSVLSELGSSTRVGGDAQLCTESGPLRRISQSESLSSILSTKTPQFASRSPTAVLRDRSYFHSIPTKHTMPMPLPDATTDPLPSYESVALDSQHRALQVTYIVSERHEPSSGAEIELRVGDRVVITKFLDRDRAEGLNESTGALGVIWVNKIMHTRLSEQ
ncbi:uncharacterized protein BJ171DRAFT_164748 [Polychytrium aggregatum]|uniref:uncharacterized protein n=1 Tax=Polychytrium aggregatum TaxID=110093 RepID=UPI0022FEEE34|nr:uncharacterized protein BJ171DRAFT_164748 [Polychytrium aggregatum]KAI9202624.1 hypothetical protein BJ171DRAFT_164748 [Polychytrium aggregatum]